MFRAVQLLGPPGEAFAIALAIAGGNLWWQVYYPYPLSIYVRSRSFLVYCLLYGLSGLVLMGLLEAGFQIKFNLFGDFKTVNAWIEAAIIGLLIRRFVQVTLWQRSLGGSSGKDFTISLSAIINIFEPRLLDSINDHSSFQIRQIVRKRLRYVTGGQEEILRTVHRDLPERIRKQRGSVIDRDLHAIVNRTTHVDEKVEDMLYVVLTNAEPSNFYKMFPKRRHPRALVAAFTLLIVVIAAAVTLALAAYR
jgi:hypothetical protein